MESVETMDTAPQGAEAAAQDEPAEGTAPTTETEGGDEAASENPTPSTETIKEEPAEERSGGGEKDGGGEGEGEAKKIVKEEPRKSAERSVGITEYASDHVGFFGIIKQR